MTVRVLTGVTPSGTLHLGNYVGAIRPAIQKSRAEGTESFYFLSDYHALIKTSDPDRVEKKPYPDCCDLAGLRIGSETRALLSPE